MTSHGNIHLDSLQPAVVNANPDNRYASSSRLWQGIPGIECTEGMRLYATWYSGGRNEGPDNYVLLIRSEDGGKHWSEPLFVVDPPGSVRAFDPVLWIDPLGRLWWFWSQSYTWWNGRGGVWFVRCDQPDAEVLNWTAPQRIGNGVMMNKPLVTRAGEWLFPLAVWGSRQPLLPELRDEAFSSVYVSKDQGRTFMLRGSADIPFRTFDEHMFVERQDGSLWMLVRTTYGVGQSFSYDGGVTWSPGVSSGIPGPDSRFHIRRLASGRLLLINHRGFSHQQRSHMTASLSDDDGVTWSSHLLLDERQQVSYPDTAITPDGRILIIYDRERYAAREILYCDITEEDILVGKLVSERSFLKRTVNKIPGSPE
jgi:hypothetical protein